MIEGDRNNSQLSLKTPSGNNYRVTEIIGVDNNAYQVIETSDWTTITGWIKEEKESHRINTEKVLEAPSGSAFKVIEVEGSRFLSKLNSTVITSKVLPGGVSSLRFSFV